MQVFEDGEYEGRQRLWSRRGTVDVGPSRRRTQIEVVPLAQDGTALIAYLLDSEVHTFAFSVAANAILSFIPFIVLLYTLAQSVFHSDAMVDVLDDMVQYFLPSNQDLWRQNLVVTQLRSTACRFFR